ncbi:MAG: tryptophan--tRNA ligase, partial [Candidatus Micrarchaeota archaeon]|nr:tryptophan--tRNA ligase [Candidatus Micrarchaeota archaeon]
MAERINPWGDDLVKDYDGLFKEFGLQHVDEKLLRRLKRRNRLFRRGIVFAHRDFDKFLDAAAAGKKSAVMSGIKPSGEFHLGSKMTAEEIVFIQNELKAKAFYCVADLEAYADNGMPVDKGAEVAVDNVADLLALGLDEKNAVVYKQSEQKIVSNLAFLFSRKTTLNTLEALYGHQNLGLYQSVLVQAGDILHPQLNTFGAYHNVVVPVGIDQDPHIRFTRDIAYKFRDELGFSLPAATYHKTFRALNGEAKMSKRDPMNMLTLSDKED